MINKTPETDIGVQPEDEKGKATSHCLLPLPQTENDSPVSRNSQNETDTEHVPSCFIFLSTAGVKGMCHYHLASLAN